MNKIPDGYFNVEGFLFKNHWRSLPNYPDPPDDPEVPSADSQAIYDNYRKALKKFYDEQMCSVPTAEEFLKQYQKGADSFCVTKGEAINKLIEFANLHVKACKEDIVDKAKIIKMYTYFETYHYEVDRYSILNSYPKDNIK